MDVMYGSYADIALMDIYTCSFASLVFFCIVMGYWPYHEFIMLVCVKHGHTDQSARRWRRASQASQAVSLAKMLADGVGGHTTPQALKYQAE